MSYKVKLEIFEGPLDLLLYLVKQNRLEIAAIPIASITDQYLKYLELMQALDLEIAGEFLVVAATLLSIKSRQLLPAEVLPAAEEEELDPTAELIARLKEYQRYKEAAVALSQMEKDRFIQVARALPPGEVPKEVDEYVEASLFDLLTAFSQFVSEGISREAFHEIIRDEFTVEEKVELLKSIIEEKGQITFNELFGAARSKAEIISTFLALLELIRQKEVEAKQSKLFDEIVILRTSGSVGKIDQTMERL